MVSTNGEVLKRATSVELTQEIKTYFGVKCEKNGHKKSPLMNVLLERFWVIAKKNPKIKIIRREETDEKKTLMGFELTTQNWAKLNEYVSQETMKGNKILKTDVLLYVIEKYLNNVGFFGDDL